MGWNERLALDLCCDQGSTFHVHRYAETQPPYFLCAPLLTVVSGLGYGVYLFFATMLILAAIYAFFFIHETKGLRIDQMDLLFGFDREGTENRLNRASSIIKHKEESSVEVEEAI